jgi:hypothetical protein
VWFEIGIAYHYTSFSQSCHRRCDENSASLAEADRCSKDVMQITVAQLAGQAGFHRSFLKGGIASLEEFEVQNEEFMIRRMSVCGSGR